MELARRYVTVIVVVMMALGALAFIPGQAQAITPIWTEETTMPQGATCFAYCKLSDGRVLMSGGYNQSEFSTLNDTYIYDPSAGSWTEMASSPMKLYGSSAMAMPDGKVYVFGGYDTESGDHLTTAMIFDVSANTWTLGSDAMPDKRWNLATAALDDTRILIAGGQDIDANLVLDTCYVYDIEEDTFTSTGVLPGGRAGGAIVEHDGYAYYLGGWDDSFTTSSIIFVYYPGSGNWYNQGNMPMEIVGHRAVYAQDGAVYFVGGSDSTGWTGVNSNKSYLLSMYDLSLHEIPELDVSVRYAGLVELDGGELFMFGGHDGWSDNDKGYSLRIWSKEAWVDKSTVGTGESLRVYVNIEFSFHGPVDIYSSILLANDGIAYHYQEIYAEDGMIASGLITVPTDLEPGTYELMFFYTGASTSLGGGNFDFEPFEITVTAAPTLDDRLDDLEAQNQALQDQLEQLGQDLNDTQQDLADARAELKDATDAKLDAMIGYVILIMVIITLVIGVVILVRKK